MVEDVLSKFEEEIAAINDSDSLNHIKSAYLGKNGVVNARFKNIASLNLNERKEYSQKINEIKQKIEEKIAEKAALIQEQEQELLIQKEELDVTLPARTRNQGTIHPISQTTEILLQIFSTLFNFKIVEGPSIENDWYNFTALNIGQHHPARQMHDTFYLKQNKQNNDNNNKQLMLRTHTSNVQIRTMELGAPPIYLVAPGRTYRADSDATHTPMFHQIEGLAIDRNLNMGNLKYLINNFIRVFFERDDIEIVFRPSFFPFTEPSAEIDIKCPKTGKWIEVLGCGMVHPNVLRDVNIDSNEYQGFAWGLGIERFAMLKYGITDLRKFFENDQRWLQHYSFSAFDVPTILRGITR